MEFPAEATQVPHMVNKREVLELIGERTRNGMRTSFRRVADELLISEDAACSHLCRLWRARLIETSDGSSASDPGVVGTSVRDLRFRISDRGRARLEWWKERDREREEPW
jgi:hypothetical protein